MPTTDDPALPRSPGRGALLARPLRAAVLVCSLLLLAGCATAPDSNLKIDDPLESANRTVFHLNYRFNKNVTLPIAWVYVNYVPGRVRLGVRNVLANAESPVTFANDLLQGEIGRAGETLVRFTLNSSFGLGGLVDVGRACGIKPHQSDFGQTLALYGVPAGPFLMLPLIGPATPRDVVGMAGDFAADPLFYLPPGWSLYVHAGTLIGIHTVAPFERNAGAILLRQKLSDASLDPYATMRAAYYQQRAHQIDEGRPVQPPDGDE